VLDLFERQFLSEQLEAFHGNVTDAAALFADDPAEFPAPS